MRSLNATSTRLTLVTVLLLLLAATPAGAAGRHTSHPGYVDGSRLVEFAESNGELIEVTLHGRLLRLITRRAIGRHDKTLADILGGLESMHAVIADFGNDDDDETDAKEADRARGIVRTMSRRLDEDGWERFVRVREKGGENLVAYVHMDREDEIDGLVVMGMTGGTELLFVNLAGRIDMEAVTLLGERFKVPGLDDLPRNEDVKKRRDRDRPATDGSNETRT